MVPTPYIFSMPTAKHCQATHKWHPGLAWREREAGKLEATTSVDLDSKLDKIWCMELLKLCKCLECEASRDRNQLQSLFERCFNFHGNSKVSAVFEAPARVASEEPTWPVTSSNIGWRKLQLLRPDVLPSCGGHRTWGHSKDTQEVGASPAERQQKSIEKWWKRWFKMIRLCSKVIAKLGNQLIMMKRISHLTFCMLKTCSKSFRWDVEHRWRFEGTCHDWHITGTSVDRLRRQALRWPQWCSNALRSPRSTVDHQNWMVDQQNCPRSLRRLDILGIHSIHLNPKAPGYANLVPRLTRLVPVIRGAMTSLW